VTIKDLLVRAAAAVRRWSDRRTRAAGRRVIHQARVRRDAGPAYRAWFADRHRLERVASQVASFAWSIDVDAWLVAPGVDDPEPHLLLSGMDEEQVAAFRQRFSPSRDRIEGAPPRGRFRAGGSQPERGTR